MTERTIAAMIAGQPTALATELAQMHLNEKLPEKAAADSAVSIERGERFAVSRGVAVVPLRGLLTPNSFALERWLGWTTYHGLEQTCAELAASDDVAGVVLEIDSPGGLVIGIEAGAKAIAALAAVKPVHALVNPTAASAAYWLGSQATDITLTPGGIVGSIGVAVSDFTRAQPDVMGNQWFDFTSSHARAKWPDPGTEEGRAEIQRCLDESEARFHEAVAQGRRIEANALPEHLSVTEDGRDGGAVFTGQEAVDRSLADTLETRDEFYDRVFAEYAPPSRTASRAFMARAKAAQAKSIT